MSSVPSFPPSILGTSDRPVHVLPIVLVHSVHSTYSIFVLCIALQRAEQQKEQQRNKKQIKSQQMNKQIEQSYSSVRARIRFVSTVSKPLTQRMWFGKIPYVTLISNYLVQRKVCAIPYVRLISNHLVQRSSAAKYLQLLTRTHGCSYCRAYAISLY
jgi:hypothetical protein